MHYTKRIPRNDLDMTMCNGMPMHNFYLEFKGQWYRTQLLHPAINDVAFGPIIWAINFVIVAVGFILGFFSRNRFAPRAQLGPRVCLKNMYGKYGATKGKTQTYVFHNFNWQSKNVLKHNTIHNINLKVYLHRRLLMSNIRLEPDWISKKK